MTITAILEVEDKNTHTIYLFKEGMFWRVYQASAYLFVTYIKEYKVIRKYIKIVKQDVFYLGFPDSAIKYVEQKANDNGYVLNKTATEIVVTTNKQLMGFEQWKQGIDYKQITTTLSQKTQNNIISQITKFSIENASPMQALLLIHKLKLELSHGTVL